MALTCTDSSTGTKDLHFTFLFFCFPFSPSRRAVFLFDCHLLSLRSCNFLFTFFCFIFIITQMLGAIISLQKCSTSMYRLLCLRRRQRCCPSWRQWSAWDMRGKFHVSLFSMLVLINGWYDHNHLYIHTQTHSHLLAHMCVNIHICKTFAHTTCPPSVWVRVFM